MTDELNNNIETEDSENGEAPLEEARPLPYAADPNYKDLLKHYQNADWDAGLDVITSLLKVYPEDPGLLEFEHEIQMRVSMQRVGQESDRVERREQLIKVGTQVVIGLVAATIVFFAIRWGFNLYNSRVDQARLERTQVALAQELASKYESAEKYMQGGRINEALALYEEIQEIDPEYDEVSAKIVEAEALLELEAVYQQGRSEYLDGELETAKQTLQKVLSVNPRYKDAAIIVKNIDNTLTIEALRQQAQEAYENNDWKGVVQSTEEIKRIDNTTDLSDLEVQIFTSLMNLVIETAESGNASVEDVELAERYYREALALFPQNKDFAKERAELQRVASDLVANKFYIFALQLIEQEDYSIESMEEALRLLNKATNIGTGSPAIAAEISQLTLFLSAFDNFVGRRWEQAIDRFEQLYRTSPDYGNGMLKYLIYETYLARGDTFYSFAEYSNARTDYEAAETYARVSDQGNTLRLYQIEIRIGYTLRKLALPAEASEYFSYALNLVNFSDKLEANEQDIWNTYLEAEASLAGKDYWNAARLFEILLEDADTIYDFETLSISRGDSLAHIAFQYGSSVDAILLSNPNLGDSLTARTDQEIRIPILAEDQN